MEGGMWLPHPLWGENKSEPGRTHMWQVARSHSWLRGIIVGVLRIGLESVTEDSVRQKPGP